MQTINLDRLRAMLGDLLLVQLTLQSENAELRQALAARPTEPPSPTA